MGWAVGAGTAVAPADGAAVGAIAVGAAAPGTAVAAAGIGVAVADEPQANIAANSRANGPRIMILGFLNQ